MKDLKETLLNEGSYAGYEDIIKSIESNCDSEAIIEMCKDIAKKPDKPIYGFKILGLVDELLKYMKK